MNAPFIPGPVALGGGRARFTVWAPAVDQAVVHLLQPDRLVPLTRDARGIHVAEVEGVPPGTPYLLRLGEGPDRPDPASRHQPKGSHGPSEIVDLSHPWTDRAWRGLPLEQLVFYELHIGTFTPEGTFDAAIGRLDALVALGITAVEVLPVSQFPGSRNWGYDGTFPFAVQSTYGGPAAMRRFVDACHARGLAVVLDVVYNHLGPEGNYLWGLAPAFTDRYRTPWGPGLNVDGPGSDETREFFIQTALLWVRDYHVDGLRLDAVHAIIDVTARPFLQELADRVREEIGIGRKVHLIAESDRNDPRMVRPVERGGLGLDAVWNDDFHHALRTMLTGEREGYYADFGTLEQLARGYTDGFVYAGQYSAFRERRHGASSRDLDPSRLVVFIQNHDQIGNRMKGGRLQDSVSFEKLKLAAAAVILSPNLPLLFMGEEYGETAPFAYFVSHSDPGLIEAVRRGRREEFEKFRWVGEPPDPQAEETFRACVLDPSKAERPPHRELLAWYRALLALRREAPFSTLRRDTVTASVFEKEGVLLIQRSVPESRAMLLLNFGEREAEITLPSRGGVWTKQLDSTEPRWGGTGSVLPAEIDLEANATLRLPSAGACVYRMPGDGPGLAVLPT